ncbi:MAG: lysylphosphatidylglycerol synthase domain-containing protein [Pseudomonadota bacterium]|nr:lysylphosphatidylglycerol synthase domain-containing protein [Pseudomonadota bacterium]
MSWREWWPTLRKVLFGIFLIAAAGLLWRYASAVRWSEVGAAIADYPGPRLALAAAVSLTAYVVYCSLELLARRSTGHCLPPLQVLAIALVCYAFNLNLGGMVGGIGFRYRLYSRSGLGMSTISRIVAFVVGGNWSGFLLLAGLALALNPLPLPPDWEMGARALRFVGGAMVAAELAWLALCAFSPRRSWTLRGHEIELPSIDMAFWQLAVASASWLAIASILYVLLPPQIDFLTVAGALALSVVANVITHIPGNIGVLEAVFVAMLGTQAPPEQIIAALLVYRAVFYIGPLLLALAAYPLLELQIRRGR